jgi:hypothetical protein
MPRILKHLDLGLTTRTSRVFENNGIILIRIERWIKLDQIDAILGNVLTQNFKIIAIIKLIIHVTPVKVTPVSCLGYKT